LECHVVMMNAELVKVSRLSESGRCLCRSGSCLDSTSPCNCKHCKDGRGVAVREGREIVDAADLMFLSRYFKKWNGVNTPLTALIA